MLGSVLYFLWFNNILLYGYTPFYLSIPQLMDIYVTSVFWPSASVNTGIHVELWFSQGVGQQWDCWVIC